MSFDSLPFHLCLQTNEEGGLDRRGGRDTKDQKESKDMTREAFEPPSIPAMVAKLEDGLVMSPRPCHDGYQTSAFPATPGQKGEGD